jgi:hypothetical protein
VIVKSARRIASAKEGLGSVGPEIIFSLSVVGVGSIEQISEFPSRLITNGAQRVASPIVAASKGTETI